MSTSKQSGSMSQRGRTRPRWPLAFALAVLTCCFSSTGFAKRQFPGLIQRDLSLSYEVPCSVCHLKGNTGSSTAGTPFALSLRDRGLSGDSNSLSSALSRLQTDGVDSDGDGIPDVTELRAGTDPNSSANARIIDDQEPGYGCGGSAPRGSGDGGPTLGALGLLVLLIWRRGRT